MHNSTRLEASPIPLHLRFPSVYQVSEAVWGERSVMGCNPNGVAWHGEDDCQYTKGVKKLAVGAKSGGQFFDAIIIFTAWLTFAILGCIR